MTQATNLIITRGDRVVATYPFSIILGARVERLEMASGEVLVLLVEGVGEVSIPLGQGGKASSYMGDIAERAEARARSATP